MSSGLLVFWSFGLLVSSAVLPFSPSPLVSWSPGLLVSCPGPFALPLRLPPSPLLLFFWSCSRAS
ncbi:MAG: hypothetical protein MZV64_35765 [Ignavibacteriales bacterium]|nr:hypothetical protein [Ignavibacteriales bacterium]